MPVVLSLALSIARQTIGILSDFFLAKGEKKFSQWKKNVHLRQLLKLAAFIPGAKRSVSDEVFQWNSVVDSSITLATADLCMRTLCEKM